MSNNRPLDTKEMVDLKIEYGKLTSINPFDRLHTDLNQQIADFNKSQDSFYLNFKAAAENIITGNNLRKIQGNFSYISEINQLLEKVENLRFNLITHKIKLYKNNSAIEKSQIQKNINQLKKLATSLLQFRSNIHAFLNKENAAPTELSDFIQLYISSYPKSILLDKVDKTITLGKALYTELNNSAQPDTALKTKIEKELTKIEVIKNNINEANENEIDDISQIEINEIASDFIDTALDTLHGDIYEQARALAASLKRLLADDNDANKKMIEEDLLKGTNKTIHKASATLLSPIDNPENLSHVTHHSYDITIPEATETPINPHHQTSEPDQKLNLMKSTSLKKDTNTTVNEEIPAIMTEKKVISSQSISANTPTLPPQSNGNIDILLTYTHWLVDQTLKLVFTERQEKYIQADLFINELKKQLSILLGYRDDKTLVRHKEVNEFCNLLEETIRQYNNKDMNALYSLHNFGLIAYFSEKAKIIKPNENVEEEIKKIAGNNSTLAFSDAGGIGLRGHFKATEKFEKRITVNAVNDLKFIAVQEVNKESARIIFKFNPADIEKLSDTDLLILAIKQVEDFRCLIFPKNLQEITDVFNVPINILPGTHPKLAVAIKYHCDKMEYPCSFSNNKTNIDTSHFSPVLDNKLEHISKKMIFSNKTEVENFKKTWEKAYSTESSTTNKPSR